MTLVMRSGQASLSLPSIWCCSARCTIPQVRFRTWAMSCGRSIWPTDMTRLQLVSALNCNSMAPELQVSSLPQRCIVDPSMQQHGRSHAELLLKLRRRLCFCLCLKATLLESQTLSKLGVGLVMAAGEQKQPAAGAAGVHCSLVGGQNGWSGIA